MCQTLSERPKDKDNDSLSGLSTDHKRSTEVFQKVNRLKLRGRFSIFVANTLSFVCLLVLQPFRDVKFTLLKMVALKKQSMGQICFM